MTELQKRQIAELQGKGYGYVKISKELGMNMDTVKSHCRRKRLWMEQAKAAEAALIKPQSGGKKHYCPQCGAEVEQTPGRKEKRFCSDFCRMKWWNRQNTLVKKKRMSEHACPNCGKIFEFYGRRSQRKYCSHECYIQSRYGKAE